MLMPKISALFYEVALFFITPSNNTPPPREALNAMTASDIRRHIDFLAADSLMGRNAPDSVSVGGVTHSPDLIKINEEENREVGMVFDLTFTEEVCVCKSFQK
jgi:hypothetical protein